MEGKTTIGNVCFIKDASNKKVLLLKRNREPMKGLYTGVGGKTFFEEDIRSSCFREVKEETGLEICELELKGVIKTILCGGNSAWILFVYTAKSQSNNFHECPEGILEWLDIDSLDSVDLIGFIKEIITHVLSRTNFIEGTLVHDLQGNILDSDFHLPFVRLK